MARLRHERLSALGFSPVEVFEAVETAFQGAEVGQVFDGNRVTDVTVLLLATAFRRGRNLLLVPANAPFALVGGVLAGFAGGGLLSVGALVGCGTLFGISTRNSIMVTSHFEHLARAEGCAWTLATALRGAGERLVPILMTALVILGGLITSTALNLLVPPVLAARWKSFSAAESRGELK